jgi:uncharacterized protein (DUF2141 family)
MKHIALHHQLLNCISLSIKKGSTHFKNNLHSSFLIFVSMLMIFSSSWSQAPTFTSFGSASTSINSNLVITGTNLTGTTSLMFGATPARFTVNSNTQITATVPRVANSGRVRISKAAGSALSSAIPVTRQSTSNVFTSVTAFFNSIAVGYSSVPTFTDLDGDGLLDMLVGEIYGSMRHYEQISANSTSFTLRASNFNNIAVGFENAPTFTDLDGDGLLDMLIGEYNGNLNHYEQSAANSTSFNLVTENFSGINVGAGSNSVPTFTDLDGDGLLDLIVGEVDGNLNHFEQSAANSTSFALVTPSFNGIDVGKYSTPTITDLDGDGLLDMIVGEEFGALRHYEQSATNSTSFTLVTSSFNGIAVGTFTKTAFTDLDGDGLLDMVIGEFDGNLNHYEQNQSPIISTLSANPVCQNATVSITGTGFTGTTLVTINGTSVGTLSGVTATNITFTVPTNAISGNVVVTTPSGTSNAVAITINTPIFTSFGSSSTTMNSSLVITGTNLTGTTSVRFGETPARFTVNSNTQITATVPKVANTGKIRLTNSTGCQSLSTSIPVTRQSSSNIFSSVTAAFNSIAVGYSSAPAFTDLDGDGLLDMLVGEIYGSLKHYEQISANSASFTLTASNFNNIAVGFGNAPTFTDLDGDGLLDMLIGEYNGNINHYEQSAANSILFSLITENFNLINVGAGSNSVPTFTDLDGDGLLDMIVGETDGNLNHYEQIAANSTSFTFITSSFNGIDVGRFSTPTITDLDGDGLLDMLVGEEFGSISHYEQSSANSTSFTLITTNFNGIDVGNGSIPAFTDLDGDGLLDMIIGEFDGNLNHYEQIQGPIISTLSANPVCRGATVSITGTNFTGATLVTINGSSVGVLSGVTATNITFTVPVNATSGNVVVTTPSGTSNAVAMTVSANNTAGVASSSTTQCINTPLTNITHTTTGASGIGTATGLPAGVSAAFSNNTITISGTATALGTFTYSIPLTGGCSSVSATGTITVKAFMNIVSLPLDTVPNVSVALSLSKLRSAYSGPALRLRRGSDNVEQDFSFVGNDIDVNAISTWLNGASGYCTKLYDQSGNAGDVSQTTPAAQPLLVLSGFNNKPLLRFTTAQTMFNNVNYPAPFSVIYGSRVIGTSERVLSAKNNNWLLGYWAGKQDRAFFGGWISEGSATTVLNQYNSYATTGTGSISTFYKNGVQIASNGNGLQGPNGIQLNGTGYSGSSTETSNCEFTDIIIFGSVLAPATIAELSDNNGVNFEQSQTLCINSPLSNITYTTIGASGIGAATNLPAGVTASWANNTITISGTPTASGIFNYSIPLTGGCGSASATGTIIVNANMIAGAASSTPTLCVNTALTNITHTTTGASGIGTATGLPAGVSAAFSNNTITISGTATASGTFIYSIPLTGDCSSVSATGTITVTSMAISSLPIDNVPNASLALSLRRLSSAYSGPALRLRRESDNMEQDFSFVGNDLDVNAIITWLNGASGYCTKLYDQSGNAGDVSQTDPAVQPLLVLSGFNNKPLLRFTTAQTMFNNVNYPAPFSVIYGSRVIGTSARVLSAKNNNWLLGYWGGSQDRAYFEGWTSQGSAATVLNQYNCYAATGTGSISTVYKNGIQIASNSNGLQGPNGIQLNGAGFSGSTIETSNCEFTDVIIYGSALPVATIVQLSDNTAENYVPSRTLCINTPLNNITYTTIGASGIGAATNLPAGVTASWANNTITISGTPTASGIFNYSIPLTGGCGSVNATGTITVIGNMIVGAASSTPSICVNTALTNITHITSNTTGIGTATGLPSGVTAAFTNNTITISGTPTQAGIFNYSIGLTGGCSTANATGTITVNGVNAASSTPTLCINAPLTNITHTTSGVSGIGAATNLPAGVSASWANNTITISGTPTASGIFNYSIPITGGCGSASATGTITVNANMIAGAASGTQTLCVNTALTNITHTTAAATGIITYPAPSYALPTAITYPTDRHDLGNVTITSNGATILNNSTLVNSLSGTIGTATGTAGSYANYTAFGPYALYPGATYSFSLSSITASNHSSNSMAIYIDYNRNGLFTDEGEKVYASAATTSGAHTETGTFTIPLAASVGLTRMRVISGSAVISSPTQSFTYGEYEDYSINLGRSSGLPSGVTASWANNTVTISGTPTESGTFNYSIDLTGDCSTATATGTITVNPADLQPSAGSNGNLTICSTTNLTDSLLFAALMGTPAAGGVWSPTPNVANGSMTYTYTQPEIAPCGITSATVAVIVTAATVTGNDMSTSVVSGKNIAITPNMAPASTTALMGYTNTNFKGLIAVNPTTGVINITNAHPAGTYSVIVKTSNSGCAFATIALTVTNPSCSQKQFTNMPLISVDSYPNSVAVGDFNGDGKQDIATANGSGTYNSTGSVSIRLGDGQGGFSGSTNVAVGSYPKSIAIGDFNRDGKQDIATANFNSATVSILLGDGLGGLSAATNVAVGARPGSVAVGDFNRDGKQDIATANGSGSSVSPSSVSIRLGDGLGGFSGTTNVAVASEPTSVAVGDFNSDGKQDIATASYYSISIRLGDGLGGFSFTSDFPINIGSYHTSIALVDFNGDGKQDISTTSNSGSSVSISLGDGLGGFGNTIYVAAPLRSQAIGDFNGDGKQDIIGTGGSFMYILSDDGLGGCSVLRETLSIVTTVNYRAPAVGDFNEDGIQDIAMVRSISTGGQVLFRLGKPDAAEINLKGNGVPIASGNTNTDTSNNTDFGTASTRTFTIKNTGIGPLSISSIGISGVDAASFTTNWTTYPVVIAAGIETSFNLTCYSAILGTKTATITINNDDCDQVTYSFKVQATNLPLTLGSYAAATIPTAGGNATITPSAAPTGNGLGLTATTSADFKGKLTADPISGVIRITNAQPAGVYQITVNTGLGLSQIFTLTVGNTICSQGQFLPATSLNVGVNPGIPEVADFNNDGYQDFAVIFSSTPGTNLLNNSGVSIQLGNGSGGFTTAATLSFTVILSYLSINDFNGDGNADIVARGNSSLYILLGNGLGGFTSGATITLSSIGTLTSILSEDLDQDSKIDFVVSGTAGFAVLKGNGQGGFSVLNTYNNGINLNFIEKGDFNGDGFTDLSMGNPTISPSDGSNFIYFGDGNGGFSTGTSYSLGGFSRLSTVGDFDGDGKSDILSALANTPGTVAFQKNNGDSTFATPTYIAVGDNAQQVVSGDFNGDGKLDFATGNTTLSTVSVRYGNGDGTFYGSTELLTNAPASSTLRMIVGDFNNDGVQDIGTANNSSTTDNFSIFLGVSKKINIQGNAIAIISGDSLPDTADDTDFGAVEPNNPVTKTYTIQNGGTSDLVVSNITLSGLGAANFTVGNILLPATVSAGNNVTFDLTFTSADLGVFNATVNVVNDDCNNGLYDFAVKGSVCTVVTPTLAIQSDALLAICPGTSVNFSVDTSENMGTTPSYVWMKNGSAIPGEIASTYSTSNLLSTDQIALEMSSSLDSGCLSQVSNLSLPLSILLKDSTVILTQPTAAAGCSGTSQVFNVLATGTGALSYQWKKVGAPLMGETDSVLTVENAQVANAGLYTVDVSAECGTIASDTISLNVYPLPTTVATISTADLTDVSMCGKNSAQLVANDPVESQGVWSVADAWNIQFGSVNASTTSIVADNAALGGGLKKLYWSHIRTTDGVNCSSKDSIFVDFKQPTITPIASVIQNGDVVWGGLTDTDWSTGSNWYVYSSSGGANVLTRLTQGEPSATTNVYMLSDVIAGNCMSSTNVPSVGTGEFSNNLYVGQNATLNLSSGTLTLKGDLTNNGTLNPNSGTVIFSGTNAQRITGSGSVANFNNLTVNKSLGTLSLEQAITVSGTLTMTAGNIQTDSTHILEVGTSKSNPGSIAWVNGTVVGPLKRWFSADPNTTQASGIFPVGTSEFNRYAQINFTDASTGGYLIIKYVDGLPANAYDNFPLLITENNTNKYIQNADQDGYWEMTPYNESGVAYGSLDDKAYDLFLRINNPYSVQNGGILANPPGVRLIRAKGHSDGSHDDWAMAGTHTSTQALTVGEDYIVGAGGVVGFSWFNGGGDNANPLPIELLSFAGNCDQDQVVLNWQTASEHQSSYFEIEKSRNGMEWEVLNTQAAAGYSTETLSYTFIDANANNTENYYRMTQFDENGQSETFNPIVVSCDANSTIFRTMPNPSASSFQVIVSNALLLGKASIKMVDTKGLVVSITEVEIVDGVNVFYLNENVAPGIYYISIDNGIHSTTVLKHSVK